jgi:B-cell receptor-associated protein 31
MYLCGFTLFLSLILNRTYVMILETLRLEEELKRITGDPKAGNNAGKGLASEPGEIAKLKRERDEARAEVTAMRKQTDGLQREYNRLGMEKTVADVTPKKDK